MATVRNLVRLAMQAAQDKKAREIMALDVRGLSSVTDYMVVCTGSSDTNVRAIAEGVEEKLRAKGERPLSVEGLQEGTWVLLDYVDFVVHVFHAEKRLYFGLEELWADARQIAPPAATAKAPGRKAERPAAAPAPAAAKTKEPLPPVRRTALKPAAKKGAVPKKDAARRPAPKRAAVPKRKARE